MTKDEAIAEARRILRDELTSESGRKLLALEQYVGDKRAWFKNRAFY